MPVLGMFAPLDAVASMPDGSEAQDYAYDLHRAYPGKLSDVFRAVFHNPWCVHSRDRDLGRFIDQILEMKANNCIVCHRNGPLHNLIMDSPQTQNHGPCNHFCCTECWEGLATYSDPGADEVPCPMCRQDVREYLISQYPEEMQAAPPDTMNTDVSDVAICQAIAEHMARLQAENTRLRGFLRTMRSGVYEHLLDASICDVCGDTWWYQDSDHASYCGVCGDSFCKACAEQHLTIPDDDDAEPCCVICNGTRAPDRMARLDMLLDEGSDTQ